MKAHNDHLLPLPLNYNDHAKYIVNARNPTVNDGIEWKATRKYIHNVFFRESLSIHVQDYNTTVVSSTDEEMMVCSINFPLGTPKMKK